MSELLNNNRFYCNGTVTVVDDVEGRKAFLSDDEQYYAYGKDDMEAITRLFEQINSERIESNRLLVEKQNLSTVADNPELKAHEIGRYQWVGPRFILSSDDKRYAEYAAIKDITGISPDELWNLDYSISLFVLPRLKKFREDIYGYPHELTLESWCEILDKMIWSFQQIVDGTDYEDISFEEHWVNKFKEGLRLFGQYFLSLWN